MVRQFLRASIWVLAAVLLLGCDAQRISELEEGVATEADVRSRFGEPDRIWPGEAGEHTLEYDRQPEGLRNYMITIGADGRMSALRQVLTPANFARIQPGMSQQDVQRILGKPARVTTWERQGEVHRVWRFLESPNRTMLFTAVFDRADRVLRTEIAPEPGPQDQGGGR
ncbi:MAG: hypothetical protein Fur0019_03070 [Tibeticola sp.]